MFTVKSFMLFGEYRQYNAKTKNGKICYLVNLESRQCQTFESASRSYPAEILPITRCWHCTDGTPLRLVYF